MYPLFKAVADHALLVTFADQISDDAHASVIALDKAITSNPPDGVIETVPALVNLLAPPVSIGTTQLPTTSLFPVR